MSDQTIRILVVEPNKAPRVERVSPESWDAWYPLIDKTTDTFEMLRITENVEMLFDEDSRYKKFAPNVLVPSRAPSPLINGSFIIDMTKGRGMMPGDPGIGYHEIFGTFILARRLNENYVDLTDEDIEKLKKALTREV